jgi:hypothetical protein
MAVARTVAFYDDEANAPKESVIRMTVVGRI